MKEVSPLLPELPALPTCLAGWAPLFAEPAVVGTLPRDCIPVGLAGAVPDMVAFVALRACASAFTCAAVNGLVREAACPCAGGRLAGDEPSGDTICGAGWPAGSCRKRRCEGRATMRVDKKKSTMLK